MNDMKCPFCNEEIISDLCFLFDKKDKDYTGGRQIYKCNKCGLFGSKELWQELIHTRKALEHSEICCSEWEKQALDYKAENIALLIKSEFVIDVLKEIDDLLSSNKFVVDECPLLNITQTKISMLLKFINIKQITALGKKESK